MTQLTSKTRAIKLAKKVLTEHSKWIEDGIPKCYLNSDGSVEMINGYPGWLCDLYPDLPCDNGIVHSLVWLTTNKEAVETLGKFKEKFGFDLVEDFKKTIEDFKRGMDLKESVRKTI